MRIIFRLYDPDQDREQIVKFLFTKYNHKKGIAHIKKDDKVFRENPENNVRFVAEINGSLHCTVVLLKSNDDEFTMHSLVTSEQMKKKGLATALIAYSKVWLSFTSAKSVKTSTSSMNHAAIATLLKSGFNVIKENDSELEFKLALKNV